MKAAGSDRVSIVIPVRDDPAGIAAVIRHLERQTIPVDRLEVVVGDDGSCAELAPSPASETLRVRSTSGPPMTSYAARNRAAAIATGSILAFTDSDCLPEPEWLEQALAALQTADLVAGEVRFVAPADPTAWTLLTVDMFLDQSRNVVEERAVTANLVMRRQLFDSVGGFDESLPSGGDYDFTRRAVAAGARLCYSASARVGHPTIDRRQPFLRKVWRTNRWAAVRRARDGEPISVLGLLTFVPFLGVALARRRAHRPVAGLARERLHSSGLLPGWRQNLPALARLYFLVAYTAGLARARGWVEGTSMRVRKLRSRQSSDDGNVDA